MKTTKEFEVIYNAKKQSFDIYKFKETKEGFQGKLIASVPKQKLIETFTQK